MQVEASQRSLVSYSEVPLKFLMSEVLLCVQVEASQHALQEALQARPSEHQSIVNCVKRLSILRDKCPPRKSTNGSKTARL